jgi:ankyrin repeat protein
MDAADFTYIDILMELSHEDIRDVYDGNLDVNKPDIVGDYLLNLACELLQLENVVFFISKGADLETKGYWNNTPLLAVIDYVDRNYEAALQIAEMLIKFGVNIEARDLMKNTCFLLACIRGNLDMIKLLVSRGCDVNATVEDFGEVDNALMLADIREVREYLKTVMH